MSILHRQQPAGDAAAGPRLVAVGDLVIVYERHDKMTALVVTAGGAYDNKFGNFRTDVRGSLPTADGRRPLTVDDTHALASPHHPQSLL